ncbi:MAG: hypothetical protein JXR73_10680 [Candidatus Omnitrophica bacterium]|nr:hypothetical protein [Candidatus Omnitrophota bacterium]
MKFIAGFPSIIAIRYVCAAALCAAAGAELAGAAEETAEAGGMEAYVPCEEVTAGPQSHWFSYYDKFQFDPSGRYVLGMEIGFNDRPPEAGEAVKLGMVDLQDGNKWIEFGESRSWGWQQGCMLQWLPGGDAEVIYNTLMDGRYVSVIQDVFTGEKRVLPRPIYSVSADGKRAVVPNFSRLNEMRPGYGYEGVPDPWADVNQPKGDGIYCMNLETGESRLIVSIDRIANFRRQPSMEGSKHYFNHLLFNQDGSRFIFLHRWRIQRDDGRTGWHTRMFTVQPDGENLHCVNENNMVSHFIWKNPRQILAWAREPETGDHFYLYTDQSEEKEIVGEEFLKRDGHCTYSPSGEWILTDTYPDRERMQNLMLYRPRDGKLEMLGRFYLDKKFTGQTRCDLHGRWSRDGRHVCIDSLHTGKRQMYLLDVSEIVK